GGAHFALADAVSADGSVIVGQSSSTASGNRGEAFRWTMLQGMAGLGDLPGGDFQSTAYAVSADGTIVVGQGSTDLGREAFIWDEQQGLRNLKSVLIQAGATGISGWTLRAATAIS